MSRISFLDCKHERVQQYSEFCLDCGYNVYMTEDEYLEELRKQNKKNEIRQLERSLGKRQL